MQKINRINQIKDLFIKIKDNNNTYAENISRKINSFSKISKEKKNWEVFERDMQEEIYNSLEATYTITLKGMKKIYNIQNKDTVNKEIIEELTYQEDNLTLDERIHNHCINYKNQEEIKKQNLLYDMMRILNTETVYLFNHLLFKKIKENEEYIYAEVVNGDGCCERCSEWNNGDVWYIDEIVEPPYHPECECELVFWTAEEIGEQ